MILGVGIVIGPWVARNWWVIGDPSPIESVSLANLWEDNAFPHGPRLERQRHYLMEAKDARERQALVWRFVLRGLRERGHDYPAKVWGNVRHFLRPDGLWLLLGAEQPWPAWQHATRILFDDGIFFLSLPLFFALPGRRTAGAAAALRPPLDGVLPPDDPRLLPQRDPLSQPARCRSSSPARREAWPRCARTASRAARWALMAGAVVSAALRPSVHGPRRRAPSQARWRLRAGAAALARGDVGGLRRRCARATEAAPRSARPWFTAGRWLAAGGRDEEALAAYRGGEPLVEYKWIPRTVLPATPGRRRTAGGGGRAPPAEANEASFDGDPWLLLETAWRELPAPRGTTIELRARRLRRRARFPVSARRPPLDAPPRGAAARPAARASVRGDARDGVAAARAAAGPDGDRARAGRGGERASRCRPRCAPIASSRPRRPAAWWWS